jgi:peptidoglycan/xylan/chitin deacetylase (PgdA/CDA1 family)
VFTHALPVLARLHLPATEYVITTRISGPDPSFLTWGQLRDLEQGGVDIGSHTLTHRPLPSMSHYLLTQELVASRRVLERHLRHPIQWFAYPFGQFDARSVAAVRRAGYVLAVTTQGGVVQDAQHPLELRRYEISGSAGVAGFAGIMTASLAAH